MKVALAQTNPTVGDIPANMKQTLAFCADAAKQGAQLVVFPELSVIGYPPKDLLLKPSFVQDNLNAVNDIAAKVDQKLTVVVGYAQPNQHDVGRPLHNAVAVIKGGRVVSRHLKTLLPTYDVFDESRYFEPGPKTQANQVTTIEGVPTGLSICEDLWNDERMLPRRLYAADPIGDLAKQGAKLLVNASASPFVEAKHDFRVKLFGAQCKEFGLPLIYVNQVGGNDELVFDGNSLVLDASGNVIAQAREFEEDLLVVDLNAKHNRVEKHSVGIAAIHKALVLGLRDYARKCGFKSVVLGLSGGIDSAVTAALAVEALGKDKVVGVAMPSRYSSDHSISDAKLLADNLGIPFHVITIEPIHKSYEAQLAGVFSGTKPDVAEENLQARVRGGLLMAMSNKFNHLLLTTGNKSEIAVGYCTLYGDMCGGLAVISDVPKTQVYELARHINQVAGRDLIPDGSITKPPSAELRPNQTDQDSLPPYDMLDAIIDRYVEQEQGAQQIIEAGFDAATVTRVIKLIDRSEYKRRQAAPGLKVTSRAFGFGRRMPIAQNYVGKVGENGRA
jgi:NAD+ synthase (glutamine-hydrolysing)